MSKLNPTLEHEATRAHEPIPQNPILEGIPTPDLIEQAQEKANLARAKFREQSNQLGVTPTQLPLFESVRTPIRLPIKPVSTPLEQTPSCLGPTTAPRGPGRLECFQKMADEALEKRTTCLGPTTARLGAKIAPIGLAPPVLAQLRHLTGRAAVLTLKQQLTGLVAVGPDRLEPEEEKYPVPDMDFLAFAAEVEAEHLAADEAAFLEAQREIKAERKLERSLEEEDEALTALVLSKAVFTDADNAQYGAQYEAYHLEQDQNQATLEQYIPTDLELERVRRSVEPSPSTKNREQLEQSDQNRLERERLNARPIVGPLPYVPTPTQPLFWDSPISDEDLERQAQYEYLGSFFPMTVAHLRVNLNPERYWLDACELLKPIQFELGKAIRPLITVVTIALASREGNPEIQDLTFFAALWEIAGINNISSEHLRCILLEKKDLIEKFLTHGNWKTEATINYETKEKGVWIAGSLWRVQLPSSEGYSPKLLESKRKARGIYQRKAKSTKRYRDLDKDIVRGHTEAKYRKAGLLTNNPRGKERNTTLSTELPTGFAFELLTYCIGRAKGLIADTVAEIPGYVQQTSNINQLFHTLELPVAKGHNALQQHIQYTANLLCNTLESDTAKGYKTWLKVCWTLHKNKRIALLYQACWDVLIRSSDYGMIRSKGALVRHLLNQRGYLELEQALEEMAADLAA